MFQLPTDRGVYMRVIVTVDVRPDRGIAIDVFTAAAVAEQRTTPRDQN
jgi:hypothetical protein